MPSPPLSIIQSLSPRIAVLTSDDVVTTCEANGCRGLEELLRPWEGGTERVSILSSTLTPGVHPTIPLRFVSYGNVFPMPETAAPNADVVVDLISSYVGSRKPEEEQHYPLTRSLLLSTRPTASHETFNHPVGILLAISTSTPEPLDALQRLVGRATGPMSQAVPWMDGVGVMRFFVVIHDVSRMGEDLTRAYDLLASVKKIYGPHSTLLVSNSQTAQNAPPMSPDTTTHPSIPLPRPFTPEAANPSALSQVYASALSSLTLSPLAAASLLEEGDVPASPAKPPRRKLYGARLTAEDTQRLAALVRELVVQSLVPWMEARVREWNEVWQSNRRGITGRLFGAGRKLFGSRPSSPSPNAATMGYNAAKGYYPVVAVEALTRRLADFAFMLRDYRFASTVYDSLRRDFAQDRAWRYAAAATEMYGLSLLLSHTYFLPSTPPTPPSNPFTTLQHTDISSWLEQAALAYQGRVPANQIQLDAMRITVLYYEAWKAIGEWRGVGAALVKAGGEADEVPSAVMLEEAASADTKGGKTTKGRRRRAFHLVLAARRYETAGLKTYSRRCLERASQIYRDAPWTAAQDRIEYSLARQAYTLGESDVAVERFLRLLRKEDNGVHGSQGGVLEDLALAYEQLVAHPELLETSKAKLQLPTPIFDLTASRIVLPTTHASGSGTTERWAKVEQHALDSWDRKGKRPASLLPDQKKIVASINEEFHIELTATNPLNAPLVLSDLSIQTSPEDALTVTAVDDIELEPYESRIISIPVSSSRMTTVTISSVSFSFHRFFPCEQSLEQRGKRLHATKAQRITPTYGKDNSLVVAIGRPRPTLCIEWEEMPDEVYAGEQVQAKLRIRNAGRVAIDNVQLVASDQVLTILDTLPSDTGETLHNRLLPNRILTLPSSIINPGEESSLSILMSCLHPGRLDLLGLAVYAQAGNEDDIATATFSHPLVVLPSIDMRAEVRSARDSAKEYIVGLDVANTALVSVSVDTITPISATFAGPATTVSAEIYPNQVWRSRISVQAKQTNLDVSQKKLAASLAKLVQGQTDISTDPQPEQISLQAGLAPTLLTAFETSRQDHRSAYLQDAFPTIPIPTLSRVFPLLDPLDLDLAVSWTIRGTPARSGVSFLHGVRISPEFSVVEPVRREVDEAIAKGGKTTRTMYEETGRLRQALMDSVLDGVLSQEDDPVEVRVRTDAGRRVHSDVTTGKSLSVTFAIRNRSPLLPVRWMLDLPGPDTQGEAGQAAFTGTLSHRGTLDALQETEVVASVWITQAGIVRVTGWTLRTETGEVCAAGQAGADGPEQQWSPRRSWGRTGEEWIEVVQTA